MAQHTPRDPSAPTRFAAPEGADVWRVDAGRLWRGALPAALIGVGVAVVGLLVIRDLLDVPVLRRTDGTELVQATTLWYVAGAVLGAALATGVLHALILLSPRPFTFYRWSMGLVVVIVTLVPLTFDASTGSRIATAILNFGVGSVIVALVATVGTSVATRRGRRPRPRG